MSPPARRIRRIRAGPAATSGKAGIGITPGAGRAPPVAGFAEPAVRTADTPALPFPAATPGVIPKISSHP